MASIISPYGVAPEAFAAAFTAGSPAYTNDASLSSYTTGALNIGAASATRRIGLIVCSSGGAHVSSGTIGGVALTVAGVVQSSAGNRRISLCHASVPSGVTAVVALTMSGTSDYCCIDLLRIVGLTTSTPDNQGTAATNTVAATVPAGGLGMAAYISLDESPLTWTNATELHETILSVLPSGDNMVSGASFTASATISTSSSADDCIAYMAWGPP